MSAWSGVLLAGVVAAVLAPVSAALLRRAGAVAHPTARSSHTSPTVSGAGLAITLGTGVGFIASGRPAQPLVVIVVVVAAVLSIMGLVDDVRPLSARVRLVAQFLGATVAVVAAGIAVGGALWATVIGVVAVVVGAVWVVNAVNFMDGINGMTGMHGVLFGIVVGVSASSRSLSAVGWSLAAASLGYLPHNFPRARSFPGDAGSYFVGALVVLAMVVAAVEEPRSVVAFGALGPYMTDTLVTLVDRVRAGEHPGTPHRRHVYQVLARRLGSHTPSTLVFVGLSTLASVPALVAPWTDPRPFLPAIPAACGLVLVLRAGLRRGVGGSGNEAHG